MRRNYTYFVFIVIVALTTLFVARQRTLNDLRASNDSLRKQIDLEKSVSVVLVGESPANSAAKLSEADERELLRLRSKIVPLREQLRNTSNRVVLLQSYGQSSSLDRH
jgi:hypothetical protein